MWGTSILQQQTRIWCCRGNSPSRLELCTGGLKTRHISHRHLDTSRSQSFLKDFRWRSSFRFSSSVGKAFPSTLSSYAPEKHSVVFLGTPKVAASVLEKLLEEASKPEASFQVSAVVTQPSRPKGRKQILQSSPVELLAAEHGIARECILTPASARDESFLEQMRALSPSLCVTAAYGNFLPQSFLDIPKFGTLNIHPSLLPAFRGAAPVQRAVESGADKTGVSLAFTVLAMDAGPVLAAEEVAIDPNIKAPELLEELFGRGADLLVRELGSVWTGEAARRAVEQDPARVTHTAKITKEEAQLDFSLPARQLHDKVRAFAGWPGTEAELQTVDSQGSSATVKLKIITTEVGPTSDLPSDPNEVTFVNGAFNIACGNSTVLKVIEVQPPGKKPMEAKAFNNGLKASKKRLFKVIA